MSNKKYLLEIDNLHVSVRDEDKEEYKEILKGLDLKINYGEIHVLMGTNGSGKSTLANALTGHPNYKVTDGFIKFEGDNLLEMKPDERARAGLFLAFQYPNAITGLSVGSFLRSIVKAVNEKDIPIREFRKLLDKNMKALNIPKEFLNRSLNEGFSGGEKKRHEILQMNLLNPKLAILDETDSGLDVDAMKLVFENINNNINENRSLIIITHYNKVLKYLKPTHVHILREGRIIKSGGIELSDMIENEGFESVVNT